MKAVANASPRCTRLLQLRVPSYDISPLPFSARSRFLTIPPQPAELFCLASLGLGFSHLLAPVLSPPQHGAVSGPRDSQEQSYLNFYYILNSTISDFPSLWHEAFPVQKFLRARTNPSNTPKDPLLKLFQYLKTRLHLHANLVDWLLSIDCLK